MKTTTLVLILFLTSLDLWAQVPPTMPAAPGMPGAPGMPIRRFPRRPFAATNAPSASPMAGTTALPSTSPILSANGNANAGLNNGGNLDGQNNGSAAEEIIPAGNINFQGVDVNQVLEVYAKLVGRTLLRGSVPQASIILKTETPLTKTEAIEALQSVLAMNGIEVINVGDKFVKVLPVTDANTAGAKFNDAKAADLPELGTYVTHIVQLKYLKPTVVAPLITPFSKLANAVLAIDDNGILILRDNAENVKRMLEFIDKIDISVPAEYISEVIPIKYAQASDIASALNSLGGQGGGSTVSIGSTTGGRVSGLAGGSSSGFGGMSGGSSGGINGLGSGSSGSSFGGGGAYGSTQGTTANGTPTGGSTFQQRLSSIVNRATSGSGSGSGSGAGGKDAIQVFGQTKIIADQRSNSLLIFATRQDMENIKHVISQLDVLLAQVLIEAVIMDVTLGNTFSFGTSVAQNPQSQTTNALGALVPSNVFGGGGNNGASFLSSLTNGSGGSFANNLGSGFSYFGDLGPRWDVAMTALAADNHATVIQRPRIQTSQAKPATFFVGNTVPYITGSYTGSAYGNSSSYSQLSVGVELDVTPFINPDGLVVMDINQEIDDVNGYTAIDGNNVPNTDKRTLNSEIAVRDQDTIMLGGFIRSDKSTSRSGVPVLEDIPLLGALFSNRSDSKSREELIVLMRPTVMKTLEASAAMTLKEERRLPGVSAAAADDAADERALISAERKAEKKRAKANGEADGFFNADDTILQTDRIGIATNAPAVRVTVPTAPAVIVNPPKAPAAVVTPPNPPTGDTAAQAAARAALLQKMQQTNPPGADSQ
jgi:general secretion pathway protein D